MIRLLIATNLFFIFSASPIFSQKTKWDSLYYTKYNDRLIISSFISYRYYQIDFSQTLTKDSLKKSNISQTAEANLIYGFELNYDKFNVSFGTKLPSNTTLQKGNTSYQNYMLNFGGNRWILENSYRKYKGFYNANTSSYDTSFHTTGIYTQSPGLASEAYKTKFLFFTNSKRFSFKSGYSCNYHQLRSSFSFVLSANVYYNRLNSDSSFFPIQVRDYYDTHRTMNGLDVFAFSVYGGGSLNLVLWKHFFMNFTLILGPEEQWRTYKHLDTYPTQTVFYTSISGDARGSIGLNYNSFFVLLSGTSDFSWYNYSNIAILSKYGAVNFSVGHRFRSKTPKLYKKFQNTKIYNLF